MLRRATAQRLNVNVQVAPKFLGEGQESMVYRLRLSGGNEDVAAKVSKASDEASQLNTLNEYLVRLTLIRLYSASLAREPAEHGVLNKTVPIVPPLAVTQSLHSFSETSGDTTAAKKPNASSKMVFTMPLMAESLADCLPPASEYYFDHMFRVTQAKQVLEKAGVVVRDLHDENILLKDNLAYIGDCGQFRLQPGSEADAVYSQLLADLDLSAITFDKTTVELKQILKAKIMHESGNDMDSPNLGGRLKPPV